LWLESDAQKGIPHSDWEKEEIQTSKIFEQGVSYILITNFPQT
jgi:hypothetical protein